MSALLALDDARRQQRALQRATPRSARIALLALLTVALEPSSTTAEVAAVLGLSHKPAFHLLFTLRKRGWIDRDLRVSKGPRGRTLACWRVAAPPARAARVLLALLGSGTTTTPMLASATGLPPAAVCATLTKTLLPAGLATRTRLRHPARHGPRWLWTIAQ